MGHGVGKALVGRGFDVITCLAGRSQRTRDLAESVGFRDVPSLEDMVVRADLIMSILVPAQAVRVAKEVADAMRTTGTPRPFADCNAVSPRSASAMASIIGAAGGDYIDAGIIGGSPARGAVPRLYTSGPRASLMDELDGKDILVRDLGPRVDSASGLKMCYAAMTKGTNALRVAMLTAAETLGLYDELDRGACGEPGSGACRHGVRNTWTASQRRPLDRGDGRDSGNLRDGRRDTRVPPGGGGGFQVAGLHALCDGEPGDHRPHQDPEGDDPGHSRTVAGKTGHPHLLTGDGEGVKGTVLQGHHLYSTVLHRSP